MRLSRFGSVVGGLAAMAVALAGGVNMAHSAQGLAAQETVKAATGHDGQASGVILVGDVSTAGEAADIYILQINRIAEAMEGVTDEASADVAAVSIAETVQEMESLSDELEGQITPNQWLSAITERQQQFTQAQSRIGMAMTQIAQNNPALLQRMNQAMSAIPTTIGN